VFSALDPRLRPWATWLYETAELNQLRPRVTSTFRSVRQQQRLFERHQRGEQILPVARPGCSEHQFGLAWDMVTDDNDALGALWNSVGGRWGGRGDPVHFGVGFRPCR